MCESIYCALSGLHVVWNLLHAPGTSGPVAIIQLQFLALEDEVADAIL